jgi:hypothetical protein
MTEREYVEKIKDVASNYQAVIAKQTWHEGDTAAIQHWQSMKEKLSPRTAIEMCNAWLEANPLQNDYGR